MPRLRSVKLNDGNEIPMMAFGTGTTHAFDDCSAVVSRALESGYTHLDCAWWYKNQSSVASGIRAVGRSRGDVCITSKAGDYHGEPELFDAEVFLEATLRDLCTDYVDTYLLHADILVQQDVTKGWRQMEAIKKSGRARSIGVSNFSSQSLRTILASCEIPPAIHHVEFHPYSLFHYEASLLPLCREHHIAIGAFAPLMSLSRRKGGPVDSAVEKVRQERGFAESESQILLLWAQQASGGIVVCTTSKTERMGEQLEPFLEDSTIPPLSTAHLEMIHEAGSRAPYRHWGSTWPYYMQGEGGYQVCPVGSTHRQTLASPREHLK